MKKTFLLFLAVLQGCILFGQNVDYKESTTRYLEPSQSIFTTPIIADIEVTGNQIVYTEKEAFKDVKVDEYIVKDIPAMKKIAISRAARANNADIIIGASLDIITTDDGNIEITVYGYPAKYVNFRNAKIEDITLLKEAAGVTPGDKNFLLNPPEYNLKIKKTVVKHE